MICPLCDGLFRKLAVELQIETQEGVVTLKVCNPCGDLFDKMHEALKEEE